MYFVIQKSIGFFAGGEIAAHRLYGYTGVLTVFVERARGDAKLGAFAAGFVGIPAALGGNNTIEHFLEPSFVAAAAPGAAAATARRIRSVRWA